MTCRPERKDGLLWCRMHITLRCAKKTARKMKDVARRLNSSEQYGVVLHNILGRLRCIVKVLYNGMAEGFERWSSEACSGSIRSPPGIALKPKLSNQCSFVSFEHGHG